MPGCQRDVVTHAFHEGDDVSRRQLLPSDPASLSSQATRSKPLSIAAPPQSLGLGDTETGGEFILLLSTYALSASIKSSLWLGEGNCRSWHGACKGDRRTDQRDLTALV